MPGLAHRNDHQISNGMSSLYSLSGSNGMVSANGFWSKHREDVCYNQLQKFWRELSPQARQDLLRIDKQTLFEQARKNVYCSRCNGLLLEVFLQIVMYGKSLQLEGAGGHLPSHSQGTLKNRNDGDFGMTTECQDEVQDPSVHPWGGLTTARDGTLTLLDCHLYSKSLKGLQNVFDSARARERERELLYPDACGGGGRGWTSQGMAGYGRGHGTRETCALHSARLSVDTLVDFWSALGEETRQSLLRMKEEDFIERLMYRFDSKRFCRDCRRNVNREFKELKELKRMRREPRCTRWFCVADTAFQYEVSHDTVQADWHETLMDNVETYHHFEWAVGTGEGKSDILEFENVGTSGRVKVNGLDLGGLNACYITLRAWKMDGRCSELSVKAHALKGQQCVHCRLIVGDGVVTITGGESIRRFFEHAEEAEEEEEDDSMDKDGNEMDGECSRPQKHAKSPELAREFLLDAATVIFKEQVEKAFREGTARQNAHSIFVSLALKLLEGRVYVAFKEIITLEKQMKLLEEEEKEKREEEERKERRRTKEREKKLRRKERLRVKDKDREKKSSESNQSPAVPDFLKGKFCRALMSSQIINNGDLICETDDSLSVPLSPDTPNEHLLNRSFISNMENHSDNSCDGEFSNAKDGSSLEIDRKEVSHWKPRFHKEFQLDPKSKWSDRRRFAVVSENRVTVSKPDTRQHGDNFDITSKSVNGLNRQLRSTSTKSNTRNGGPKFGERFHCTSHRMGDRYDFHACSCNQNYDYRAKVETHASMIKPANKSESVSDISKPYYCGNKYNQMDYTRENCGIPKGKINTGNNTFTRDSHQMKKVWEPMESQRKYLRSNSDSDVTLRSYSFMVKGNAPDNLKSSDAVCSDAATKKLDGACHNENNSDIKAPYRSKEAVEEDVKLCPVTTSPSSGTRDPSMSVASNSDNCSSCLSEGDSNASSSNSPNPESFSSSDSEDSSQMERREPSVCIQNNVLESHEAGKEKIPTEPARSLENGRRNVDVGPQDQGMLPPMHHKSIPFPMFQAPGAMGYYHQSPVTWPPAPANGLIPFPPPNHYVCSSPFGYGINWSSRLMQCGAVQHITPMLNPSQAPISQPVVKANGINSKDQTKFAKPCGLQESFGESNMQKKAVHGDEGQNGNSEKSQKGNSGFSLFHFGGPVASKDDNVGDLSSKFSADHGEDDRACNKKENIEEYNLFAASNGIKFLFY
ncbi:LOW QUALITY PROTEIN: uncharacterized protein LOC130791970 [Actinidia eriantha]|uniref:LOW QUALITY PROTEIN: uncharacterized protein LOC130791970 n=1 Tax=Actinidia eriantha TaxID=165200 RepID=UPI00258B2E1A|nr:LOW QUALITY PROTEIN: uncharacterized protein LOC130791970 [Actinidia eriantha]